MIEDRESYLTEEEEEEEEEEEQTKSPSIAAVGNDQNLKPCVNSLKCAGISSSKLLRQSKMQIISKIDRFTKDEGMLMRIEERRIESGLKNMDLGNQVIMENTLELEKSFSNLSLNTPNLEGTVAEEEYEMEELCRSLKSNLVLNCEKLRTELNLFGRAHDLSYEHCYAKNDGTEIIANQSVDKALFDTCVGFGVEGEGSNCKGHQNLPDPNLINGDERLELFRQMLDEFNWERQNNQVDFHEMMIQTALPCIFEKEWDSDYDRILRIFGLDQHCAETFIVCPRRFGKTVAVAMFCAVYMYIIPNASIAIFSTAQRTSGKMMLAIYQFMKELPYFKEAVFITKNSETICIELNGNRKTMWCYPGKVGVCISLFFFICLFFESGGGIRVCP